MFPKTNSNDIPGAFAPPSNAVQMAGIGGGGVLDQLLNLVAAVADEIPVWSYYPNFRDAFLRKFWKLEPILAGGVYAMTSRIATLGFKFEGNRPTIKKYYQELAGTCNNGMGLSGVFELTALAMLTQDNGAFWYLKGGGRPDRELKGRVQDIRFLDQAQCFRSIDPDYPVIYHNPYDGTYHRIHKSRVVLFSSMTQTDELARGIGFCAVSRVLLAAQIMRDIRTFKSEKVGGKPSRGLLLINGLNPKQLAGALADNKETAEGLGFVRFKGIDTLTQINGELKGELLNLASVPDGWNQHEETDDYVEIVALGLGTDKRNLWSATTSGATKGDAEKQDQKQKGKGIGDLRRQFTHAINWRVIGRDAGVEYGFDDDDVEAQLQQAEVHEKRANTYKIFLDGGAIIPEEMRAMGIKDGILNESVLANLSIPSDYDNLSPVVDENTAEQDALIGLPSRSIANVPESAVNNAKIERETAQLEAANNANNDDEDKPNGKQPPPKKTGAKAAGSDPGPVVIDPSEIDWAIRELERIV